MLIRARWSGHLFYYYCLALPTLLKALIQPVRRELHSVTPKSPLIGQLVTAPNGRQLIQFLGIPFAEPPIGQKRFRMPEPKKPWREDYYATKLPNACVQTPDFYFEDFKGSSMWNPNTPTSEDCLYLNIWSPIINETATHPRKRPHRVSVVIWIYGGGFWSGSSALDVYDGKILASEENVVVVSINYRVTAFGFLYGGPDTDVPGNMGLYDQLEAVKWVNEHIGHFGGDRKSVTLFGESAGAASVSMHILSPLSDGYFQRAIMQSGSATAPWAVETAETLKYRLLLLAEGCGCNCSILDSKPDYQYAIDCLRNKSASLILEKEWITNEFCDFPWTPVIDGHFLVDHPMITLRERRANKVELILGSNMDEAMYFIVYHVAGIFRKNVFFTETEFLKSDQLFESAARQLLPEEIRNNPIAYDAVIQEYKPFQVPVTAQDRQTALDRMLGDFHFTCNVNDFAELYYNSGNDVYMYYFRHRSSQMLWPSWMGVLHGYELSFMFGEPLNESLGYLPAEKDFARQIMRYWMNFAREGDPNRNPDGSRVAGTFWPVYVPGKQEAYLSLDAGNIHVGNGIRRRQCAFWKQYLPKLATATKDVSEMEVRWKQEFEAWESSYIRDWKYQMERYVRIMDALDGTNSFCQR